MANHHFGKLADVWKHLVLAEVVTTDRPAQFYDTHAGHAVYPMEVDAERRFGVLSFLAAAPGHAVLSTSIYLRVLERHMGGAPELTTYPAGPMIAMLQLGDSCDYCFCDLDPDSTANLEQAAARLGLGSRVHVVRGDGLTAVDEALTASPDVSRTLVYLDPFDHQATGPGGLSTVELCAKAAHLGAGVVCWYGVDRADERHWLYGRLASVSPDVNWWCGDIMVTRAGADTSAGDLGAATSPGTGCGLVCANLSRTALDRCDALGLGLARAYQGRPLPDGRPGGLSFVSLGPRD